MADTKGSEIESTFRLKFFLIGGIILVVAIIVIIIGVGFFKQSDFVEADTNKDGLLDSSEAAAFTDIDFLSADTNGDGVLTQTEYNVALGRRSGGSGGSSSTNSGLTGFFANFIAGITGNAVSNNAGNYISYGDGWVGIGTNNPEGVLTLQSFQASNSDLKARQGKITFFTDINDFSYDGGNDAIYHFFNTNGAGTTTFSGNLLFGIGTQTPTGALTVKSNSNGPSDMKGRQGSLTIFPNIGDDFSYDGGTDGKFWFVNANGAGITAFTGNTAFGIGTQTPGGTLTIASTNPDPTIKARQGTITFFSDYTNFPFDTDLAYDGGSDGIFYMDNVGIGGGLTAFRNLDHTELLTILNSGQIKIGNLAGTGNRYVCVDSTGTLYASATACA